MKCDGLIFGGRQLFDVVGTAMEENPPIYAYRDQLINHSLIYAVLSLPRRGRTRSRPGRRNLNKNGNVVARAKICKCRRRSQNKALDLSRTF
jgi:hypothetical protein